MEQEIKKLLRDATKIALSDIKSMARVVLNKNKGKTDEFYMGMGSYCFYKNNDPIYYENQRKLSGFKKLDKFITNYDDFLYLTGNQMHIKP